jgi:ferredoxin
MEIQLLKLAYFSPTGTTKSIVRSIANGINSSTVELINITTPDARKQSLMTSKSDLLVIAVPVYMGRVPALLNKWLNAIHAHDTPTVCVVVYGNRAFENSLLELENIVMKSGCIPIAGAAYIGEHSFSNPEEPIARGRPDKDDLKHAEVFGQKVREKLQSIPSISQISCVNVPGMYPYGETAEIWNVDFIKVNTRCSQCGVCADVCPMGAVDSQNSAVIDQEKCITCCACIKNCPRNARTMKPGPVKDTAKRLTKLYKEPKKPEYYFNELS